MFVKFVDEDIARVTVGRGSVTELGRVLLLLPVPAGPGASQPANTSRRGEMYQRERLSFGASLVPP